MNRTLVVLAALTAFLLGCGSGGDGGVPAGTLGEHEKSGEARQVRTTVERWLATLTEGDNAGACSYLTPYLRRSIDTQLRIHGENGTCRTFAAKWTGGSTPPGHRGAHVTGVTVTGTKASVKLKAPPDLESDVQLRLVSGQWRIQNY